MPFNPKALEPFAYAGHDFPLLPTYVQDVVRDYAASYDVLLTLESSILNILKKHAHSVAKGDCHIWEITLLIEPGVILKIEVIRDQDRSIFDATLTEIV